MLGAALRLSSRSARPDLPFSGVVLTHRVSASRQRIASPAEDTKMTMATMTR
jgi:hypothetical protein